MTGALPPSDRLPPLSIARIEPIVLRVPIDTPVVNSFRAMHERTLLLVRAEDRDGVVGWGEVFGNFPTHGAENRAHLIDDFLAPVLTDESWASPADAFAAMTRRTHIMSIQCGEPGPFAQAIGGIDIALWDIVARKMGEPLWRLMGGASPTVSVYASGVNPTGFEALVERRLQDGYTAFKVKTGFGRDADLAALRGMRKLIGDRLLMTDINQAWDLETALACWPAWSDLGLRWIEEPLPADRPMAEWRRLAACGGSPIAAGENMRGDEQFDAWIAAGVLGVIQPDMCKWGGFSGTLPVARRILEAGIAFCPHFLAGAVGLMASAHGLAAAGGDGMLEIDANPNPLRERLAGPLPPIRDGRMTLLDSPGLGIEPDDGFIRDNRRN